MALFDRPDEILLDLIVTLVGDANDRSGKDRAAVAGLFDDFGIFDELGEVHDAPLHLALLFFGRVVIAVFRKIAEFAGGLDFLGDFDAPTGGEVGMFCRQSVEGGL